MSYAETMDTRMFDFHDFYDKIADELPNDCRIAEVGVADGASALYLAERLHSQGKNFKLYMIDSMAYGGSEQLATIIGHVQKSGLGEFIEIMPYDSLNASLKFNDNSLHFCMIDASHTYEGTKADIRLWWHKVSFGSYLAGHDFNEAEGIGVLNAVQELLPMEILRPPIENQETFKPEKFLEVYNTKKGLGVWAVVKKFYYHIK